MGGIRLIASQSANPFVNAVLVQIDPKHDPDEVAAPIRRWQRLQVYTRTQMESILIKKLIATSARQIGMFLVILAFVSAAIVAFIIYTMTLGKIREIAVLKLIGTKDRTIAAMILKQARIGSDPKNSICLPENSLDPMHARIFYHEGRLFLEDLGSESGTTLGDRKLQPNEVVPLADGMILKIGEACFEYRMLA